MKFDAAYKASRAECRELRKRLVELTDTVMVVLWKHDALMEMPSTMARGKAIAELMHVLDFTNDGAMHFGLGYQIKRKDRLLVAAKKRMSKRAG